MKKYIFIWLPFSLGILLIGVVHLDLYQFKQQNIDVNGMLMRELPIVVTGFISGALVLISTLYWLYKKQWLVAAQSFISPIMFAYCFGYGGAIGGAYLNAT